MCPRSGCRRATGRPLHRQRVLCRHVGPTARDRQRSRGGSRRESDFPTRFARPIADVVYTAASPDPEPDSNSASSHTILYVQSLDAPLLSAESPTPSPARCVAWVGFHSPVLNVSQIDKTMGAEPSQVRLIVTLDNRCQPRAWTREQKSYFARYGFCEGRELAQRGRRCPSRQFQTSAYSCLRKYSILRVMSCPTSELAFACTRALCVRHGDSGYDGLQGSDELKDREWAEARNASSSRSG
jgi:hypothetical protein